MNPCSSCGRLLPSDSRYCNWCGAEVNSDQPVVQPETRDRGARSQPAEQQRGKIFSIPRAVVYVAAVTIAVAVAVAVLAVRDVPSSDRASEFGDQNVGRLKPPMTVDPVTSQSELCISEVRAWTLEVAANPNVNFSRMMFEFGRSSPQYAFIQREYAQFLRDAAYAGRERAMLESGRRIEQFCSEQYGSNNERPVVDNAPPSVGRTPPSQDDCDGIEDDCGDR